MNYLNTVDLWLDGYLCTICQRACSLYPKRTILCIDLTERICPICRYLAHLNQDILQPTGDILLNWIELRLADDTSIEVIDRSRNINLMHLDWLNLEI